MINKFSIFTGAKKFSLEIFQNYLLFIPAKNTLDILVLPLRLICGDRLEWQEKILKIKLGQTLILDQLLLIVMFFSDINFNGHCLISGNISILKNVINLYISYIPNIRFTNLNIDFTLNNCWFGSLDLNKNADLDI